MKKLILSALFAFFSIVSADTINSVSKNPSMAVLGTQRDSATVINPYVIPVAVSGAACNSTTDIVAVTSDHSSQLICQSGTWQPLGTDGLGVGQTWQNLTALRGCNSTYINNTGKPILLTVFATGRGSGIYAEIGGNSINIASGYGGFTNMTGSIIVPKTSSYKISCANLSYITYWYELR